MEQAVEKRFKILVVDDEKDNLQGFVRVFGGLGPQALQLVAANSGKEALDILAKTPDIGVVVTDQRMEGMTGTALLEAVKTLYPDVVRVLITGYSDINVTIDAINKGDVFRYIQKPIDKKATLETLCDALAKHAEILHVRQGIEEAKKQIQQRFIQIYESVASGIAHHINNGLVPAKTFVSLVDKKVEDLKRGEYDETFFGPFLKQVASDMRRVEALIQMFLWVKNCRIENFASARVLDLLPAKDEVLEQLLQSKNIRFEKNVAEGIPETVVDREKVREMFALLLKNCAAAAPAGSALKFQATETREGDGMLYVRTRVSHAGKGYAAADLPRLFDPFYKYEEKMAAGVNGLELTNCFIIALKHGCEIKVESRPDHETTFVIDLPTSKLTKHAEHAAAG